MLIIQVLLPIADVNFEYYELRKDTGSQDIHPLIPKFKVICDSWACFLGVHKLLQYLLVRVRNLIDLDLILNVIATTSSEEHEISVWSYLWKDDL
jgi:hypothetical protein